MFNKDIILELRRNIILAGDAIMAIYNSGDFSTEHKADNSPVTVADLAADKILSEAINNLFPDITLVTEEQSSTHSKVAERFFIIDPLDGTKEFIHKRGDFTVNIGYVENGVPIFGMVYAPARNRLFYSFNGNAYEETSPFTNESFMQAKKINVGNPDNNSLRVVASKSHRDQATDNYISKYNVSDFKSAGSSLKFCLVANGEADFYPRLGPTMEWDTAAADAIVRAAGGEVLDFETKSPLKYGKPDYRNDFFLVKAKGVQLK